jgi:transposase InsO family protein
MTAQKGRTYDRTATSGETSEKALASGAVPHMALSTVSVCVEHCDDHPTGDRHPVASDGFPPVLALEVAFEGWSAEDTRRYPPADPRDEHCQSSLGCAPYPRRLLKIGIEVAQSTVAKYMAKRRPGSGQTWKTFLRNHVASIGAMDLLIVPTVGFRLLFVLVIIRHERRRLISLSVTDHPTAEWIAQQITEAFPWDEAPKHLIRDRDAAYGHVVTKRLAAMGIRDHPTALRSPWQNGHAERLIGSIRRECLDHAVVLGEAHLRRILAAYASYYQEFRTHLSLVKDSPGHRPIRRFGQLVAQPILGGLHHYYCRI